MKRSITHMKQTVLRCSFAGLFFLLFFLLRAEVEPNNTSQTASTLQLTTPNSGIVNNSTDKTDWWILPQSGGVYAVRFKTDKKVTFTLYGNNPAKSLGAFTMSKVLDTTFTFSYTGAQYIKVNGAVEEATYSLHIGFVQGIILPDDVEPNNDTLTSIPLEFGTFKEGNLGFINTTYDFADFYSVTLPEDGFIQLTVVYNDSITTHPLFGITNSLHKGKHYNAVFLPSGMKRCHYKIKADLFGFEYANDLEPNDEIEQAKPVDIRKDITGRCNLMRNAKEMDQQDLYTFTLEKDTTLTLRFLKDKYFDGAILIYQENSLNYIGADVNGEISRVFTQGKYFMKVFSPTYSGGSYRITSQNIDKIPVANFDFKVEGNTVYFNEKVAVSCNFIWDFGDGTTSTAANPSHKFDDFSSNKVILTAWNDAGKHILSKEILSNGIESFNPSKVGNKGYATLKILGRGFNMNSQVKLTAQGKTDLIADSVKLNRDGSLYCRFDLHDKTPGQYAVTVINPDKSEFKSNLYFIIQEGGSSKIDVAVSGNNIVRTGRKTNYSLIINNSGNIDARGIPLFVAISEDAEIDFSSFKIKLSQYALDRGIKFDTVPTYIKTDKVLGEEFHAKVYAFYIHYLPAGKSINRQIQIQSENDIKILVWTHKPYFGSPMRGEVADCMLDATAEAMTDQLIGLIPGASCAKSIYENVIEPEFSDEESSEESSVGSMIWDFATMAWDCTTSFFTPAKAIDFAVSLVTTIVDVSDYSDTMQECYKTEGKSGNDIKAVASYDPNEKIGPQGYGKDNCINQTSNLPYLINFENKSSATAPAQEVFITDTLNNDVYDLEKFTFTAFGFGDTTIYFNGFHKNVVQDIDLRPKKDLIVRLTAKLNEANGLVKWSFRSFDPQTMDLPEDPFCGFLPPNNDNGVGEGLVSFNVALNDKVGDGTWVKNKASIVFDNNNAIITNEYANQIDFESPVSRIKAVKETQPNMYTLQLSGTDKGAGIQQYKVYCSVNDSVYKLLKTTSASELKFTAEKGKNVKLFSLAIDSLGQREEIKSMPDAVLSYLTAVDETSEQNNFKIYPQPVINELTIAANQYIQGSIDVEIFDYTGKCLMTFNNINADVTYGSKINVSTLNTGVYILVVKQNSEAKHLLFIKQ